MIETEIVDEIFADSLLASDGVLMVHSAFRNLSKAGCRAERFIEELAGLVSNGTLVMPTFSWRTVTADQNVFDELTTPSITGTLTEVFRTEYASHRSLHPTHSTCALGPASAELLSEHHLANNPCSELSPFAKLPAVDAHILLLGVDMDSCTLVHVSEELIAPDFYMRPTVEHYLCTDRNNQVHDVYTRRHQRLNRQFTRFESDLKEKDQIQEGTLHHTRWQLFRATDLHAAVLGTLKTNPHGTLKNGTYVPEAR